MTSKKTVDISSIVEEMMKLPRKRMYSTPLRANIDYVGLARRAFIVEQLPLCKICNSPHESHDSPDECDAARVMNS
jgi:hypothetical protein